MQITHEETHKLIQFNLDGALNSEEEITLAAHLKDCVECRAYAEEIKEVESILLPVMKRQWSLQPLPLSIDAIQVKRNSKTQNIMMTLVTRAAIIGIALVAFIFSAWQFIGSDGGISNPFPVSVPPIPTPSTQSTSTKIMFQNCDGIRYIVQENDTLESIAHQFSLSKEELMAANNLTTETISTAAELVIPICNFTPTGTTHPTTLTTTYTPSVRPTTFTPDG